MHIADMRNNKIRIYYIDTITIPSMHVDPSQPILQVQVSGRTQFPLKHGLVHIAKSPQQYKILKQMWYR